MFQQKCLFQDSVSKSGRWNNISKKKDSKLLDHELLPQNLQVFFLKVSRLDSLEYPPWN